MTTQKFQIGDLVVYEQLAGTYDFEMTTHHIGVVIDKGREEPCDFGDDAHVPEEYIVNRNKWHSKIVVRHYVLWYNTGLKGDVPAYNLAKVDV